MHAASYIELRIESLREGVEKFKVANLAEEDENKLKFS